MTTLTRARLSAPARTILGVSHPLAQADERVRRHGRHAALVAALGAGAAVLSLARVEDLRAAALAALAVLVALLGARATAAVARRDRALKLIADGQGDLPVAAVQREARRLDDPCCAPALARSLDALRREARAPYAGRRILPLYVPAVIRAVDPSLEALVAALRRGAPTLTAIARTELLLCASGSPLYGDDERLLRDEIGRVMFALRA
jgi:hypothetical protein